MTFEIGDVPTGWKRGQTLVITKATPTSLGAVMLHSIELALDDNVLAGDIACLSFSYEQAGKVQQWLNWWRGS